MTNVINTYLVTNMLGCGINIPDQVGLEIVGPNSKPQAPRPAGTRGPRAASI